MRTEEGMDVETKEQSFNASENHCSNYRCQCAMKVAQKNPEIELPHDSVTALWGIIAKGLSILLYKYLPHCSSSMFIAVLFIIDRKWRHSCAFIRKPGLTNEVAFLLALLMLNCLVYIVNYRNRLFGLQVSKTISK